LLNVDYRVTKGREGREVREGATRVRPFGKELESFLFIVDRLIVNRFGSFQFIRFLPYKTIIESNQTFFKIL